MYNLCSTPIYDSKNSGAANYPILATKIIKHIKEKCYFLKEKTRSKREDPLAAYEILNNKIRHFRLKL